MRPTFNSVLAIDPGNVSGVALWDSLLEYPLSKEIPEGLAGLVAFLETVRPRTLDLLVVEDFIIRPDTYRKTREPAAYEGLGYVKGWAMAHGIKFLVVGAGEHKSFNGKGKSSKVRRLGWVGGPTKDGHAEDACSLLLHGMRVGWPETARAMLKEIATDV